MVATVGTTSSAAVDPLRPIAELCQQRGSWLHVDGAYAAAAAICPEHADILSGIERADSFVINAHKGFGLTAGCSCVYTPHEADLRATFATTPAYLPDKDDGLVNLVDYGPMFSRRLAALKLWFAIRSMGVDGLREAIRNMMALALDLAQLIDADAALELCAQTFISRTRVAGRPVLRLAIGNYMTRRDDVLLAWDVLREHAQLCQAVHSGAVDGPGSWQG